MYKKIHSHEQFNQLVDLYNSGLTLKQVSNKIGNVSETTVRNYLLKVGIKLRPSYNQKRISLNESAFESLTPESSYWIGMLLADGNIRIMKRQNSYMVSYPSKDKEHVEKFKKFMCSGHKIYYRKSFNKNGKTYKSYMLSFNSKKIYDDLIKWNIEPCKSLKEKVHPKLKFNRDYWRGLFDGDGGFCLDKTNRLNCYQLGSDNVIKNFRGFLDSHNIKYGKTYNRDWKGLYNIELSEERKGQWGNKGNQLEDYIHIHKFYNLLYKDAFTYLDRKRNYFKVI